MSSQIMVRPASMASSTAAPDEIPPQPLDPAQDEAEPRRSHDPGHPGALPQSPQSHQAVAPDQHRPKPSAVCAFPVEVIERILWTVDANGFASLVLVNRAWYRVAQNKELYAHHLSRCPSYALANTVITGPFRKNDLLRLKSKFAAEVRRNLFEAYLRPRQTLINLISVNASSSAAVPGAEAFRFSFSPNGRTILALSSSRIYVIDATSDIITVRRELKTMRRPLSASVTDDGSVLAVLSSKYQANIYHLTDTVVKHTQVLVMDNPPRTIALAPEGTVLAAAYEGGVEVFSLAPNALSTDRRAVRSEGVDTLKFSGDGSMVVGSTQSLDEPSAVVITAPFYTENDLPPKEVHSRMWTTQILFPQISSICSHAELLQGHTEGDANWLFAYDHTLLTYRAVRTDDTRTGVAYFLNPVTNRRYSVPVPCTPPTATACGTLVVAGFSGSGLWMYGVPERLDVCPDMGSVVERHEQRLQQRLPGHVALTSATGHLEPLMAYSPSVSGSSDEIEDDSLAAKVDWRESLFIKCQQIRALDGCTAAKWVEKPEEQDVAFPGKRLIMVAPGGVDRFLEELGDETMPVDGSRVSVLDFDYSPSVGQDREITIEVGDNEPELLAERMSDMDIEVAMERRRTVRDRGRGGLKSPLSRSATSAPTRNGSQWSPGGTSVGPSSPLDVDAQFSSADGPSPVQPQNTPNLHRSATAAGFITARYPPRPPLSTQQDPAYNPISPYSPNSGWESPPPPYPTESPDPVYPGMSPISPLVVSPLVQSRLGNSPLGMAPGVIPEDRHLPNHGQVRPMRQGFESGHASPPSPYQAQVPTQHQPSLHAVPEVLRVGRPAAHNNLPAPNHFDHATDVQSAYPSSTITLAVSGDSSSRPGSHEGRVSPLQTPSNVSPYKPIQPSQSLLDAAPPAQPSLKHSSLSSMSSADANFQARHNHPVPQIPPSSASMPIPPEPAGQARSPRPIDQYPVQVPGAIDAQYLVTPPTPDQMANLNRRASQTARKPLPPQTTTSNPFHSHHAGPRHVSAGPGVLPSSRVPWDAAGITGSPSFTTAHNLSNGLSRNGSPASGYSNAFSASTPNLHSAAATYVERPQIGRLDTIESVSSSYGPGEPGPRSHTVTHGVVPNGVGPLRQQHFDISGLPSSQSQFQQTRTHQSAVWAGTRQGPPDIEVSDFSRFRKGLKKKGEPDPGRVQPMPIPTSETPGPKKERRCIVM